MLLELPLPPRAVYLFCTATLSTAVVMLMWQNILQKDRTTFFLWIFLALEEVAACVQAFKILMIYQNAFELLVTEAQRRKAAQPFHLLAHSMGGLVALRFAETSYLSAQIRTLAISSPLLGLANISIAALPWLNRLCHLLPNIAIKNEGKLGTSVLSHDKELMQSREADPLIRSQARPLWIKGFIAARILAFQDIKKLLTPTGFFLAGDERVTSLPEAERFFKLLSGVKKIHIYKGLLHEIVNEVERDRVIADIFQWIDSGGNLTV